ncbi:MAG: cytochrome c biogenesis protein CcdA [Chloroflexi bacterium]|nr:cytochrome c biogenesis protein CcdA [Chloroflexota bacterium]
MNELGSILGIGIAFTGGVLSLASPGCLPLVPAYLGYMMGATGEGTTGRRPAFLHGLSFVIGFSLVFVAFYAVIGALGAFLDRRVLTTIGGALLVFLGLQVAGVINVRALWRDTRAMPTMGGGLVMGGGSGNGGSGGNGGGSRLGSIAKPGERPGYPRSFLFGLLFAAGWSPCIGPILGGILGLATATSSVLQGTVLLVAYAAGLAIPFLAVALGASWVSRRLTVVGRHHRAVDLVTGFLLVLLGVLMLTNTLGRLATLGSPFGL